ncbi:proton-conducting transporter membrane subunit [Streptomyces sp. M10(2022)]
MPAHYWIPDAVQGSTPSAAALIATLPKIGALIALFRLGAVPSTQPHCPGPRCWRSWPPRR